jgi:hypothetical protein
MRRGALSLRQSLAAVSAPRTWHWDDVIREFVDDDGDECTSDVVVSHFDYRALLSRHDALLKALRTIHNRCHIVYDQPAVGELVTDILHITGPLVGEKT